MQSTNFDHLNPSTINEKILQVLEEHGIQTQWWYNQHMAPQVPYPQLEAAIEHIVRECAELLKDRPVLGGGTWEERILEHYNLKYTWQLRRAA